MFHCKRVGLVVIGLVSLGFTERIGEAQTDGAKPATVRKQCIVNHESPSEAQLALDREEYEKAEGLYKQRLTVDTADEQAHVGLIRTLIEESKTDDARERAEAFLKERPANSLALETMGEVQFRRGELRPAYDLAVKALTVDPCNARAYLLQGKFESLVAMHAMSRQHLMAAYKLDPKDDAIHGAWMNQLPHDERIKALTESVTHTEHFSDKRLARLKEYLAHEQDYKGDDCKMVSAIPADMDAQVPLESIMDGPRRFISWGIDVQFNGKRRRLEVDTGASGLLLTKEAAASLNLVRGQKVETGGIGDDGLVTSSIAHVESIKIGGMEFHNCPVRILEKKTAIGQEIDGLIGGNFFAKYLFTLDFPRHRMSLSHLPVRPGEDAKTVDGSDDEQIVVHDRYVAPEMKDWSTVFRSGNDLLLPTRIGESTVKLFIVDTGGSINLISPAAAREVTKVSKDSNSQIRGISGDVKHVLDTGHFTWQFAGMRQQVDRMTAIDTTKISHEVGTEVSGFIGAPVLHVLVMQVDYRDNLIKFEYQP
jgi:predicted aspartyl protease